MSRRRDFTDTHVAQLRTKDGPLVRDPLSPGNLFVRINKRSKAFVVVARRTDGQQVWATIGRTDVIKIDDARVEARKIVERIKGGHTPKEPPKPKAQTVAAVVADWLDLHVVPEKMRSEKEIRRRLNSFVLLRLGERDFAGIKRSDIACLLDHVVKTSGVRTADQVLGDFRLIADWYAGRSDDYVNPIVRKMRRGKYTPRQRVLNHDEIRMLWQACSDGSRFGAVVKVLLLTGARLGKVMAMKRSDIDEGVWTVPQGHREKPTAGRLPLPQVLLDIIGSQPRLSTSPFVFPAFRGSSHLCAAGMLKQGLDNKLADMGWADIPRKQDKEGNKIKQQWTLHDLRRTARTLLTELKIAREDSERVLGHTIGSKIESTYDVPDPHEWDNEKRRALTALAFYIEHVIVDPYVPPVDDGKVIELAARRA
jgi:integrase